MSDDPGFLNEQQTLYQTICRAREALSVILRVVALDVAPSIVNMLNEYEESGDDFTFERMTEGTHKGHSLTYISASL